MSAWKATERDGAVTFDVLVQPRASRPGVGPLVGDRLRVAVAAAPVDGKANDAVTKVLSDTLGVPRSAVTIVRGETSRRKTVRVAGLTLTHLQAMVSRGQT